jgi:hypothetical protein
VRSPYTVKSGQEQEDDKWQRNSRASTIINPLLGLGCFRWGKEQPPGPASDLTRSLG